MSNSASSRPAPPADWRQRLSALLAQDGISQRAPLFFNKQERARKIKGVLIWVLTAGSVALVDYVVEGLMGLRLSDPAGLILLGGTGLAVLIGLRRVLDWQISALGRLLRLLVVPVGGGILFVVFLEKVLGVPASVADKVGGLAMLAVMLFGASSFVTNFRRLQAAGNFPDYAREPASAVAKAERPPVLFLRSFRLDDVTQGIRAGQTHTEEQGFVATLMFVGRQFRRKEYRPVLALGRPDELEAPLGATRIYVAHPIWEKTVAAIVPLCSLVVWTSGRSGPLRWELKHLVDTVDPRRLLIWPHVTIGSLTAAQRKTEWQLTLDYYADILPTPLPSDIEGAACVVFDADWAPRCIPAGGPLSAYFAPYSLLAKYLDQLPA